MQGKAVIFSVGSRELVLKESFAEEETLKLHIPIPEPASRYKRKQASFSKAGFLKSNWLWRLHKEADGDTCHPLTNAQAQ